MDRDQLTQRIIGWALHVHKELGLGLLESIYESAMAVELGVRKIGSRQQVSVPIEYRGKLIGEHRIDLIVENAVIVELKSVERFDRVFEAQILPFLRLTKLKTGLLINCNLRALHEGIKRFVL
jgi:GxxExxY protein